MFKRRKLLRTPRRQEFARRSIYILPNLFTAASLFGGFFAIIMAVEGRFFYACLAILASFVCDGLDGKVARATNTVSRFGVEFDSLADLVAFGVAPSIMVYFWGLQSFGRLGWLAGFMFVACGAMRLARFNVQVDRVGTSHFVGLPIPAAACVITSTILVADYFKYTPPENFVPAIVIVFILSFLMVSSIPYLSLKEMRLRRLKSFNASISILAVIVLAVIWPQIVFFALIYLYALLGPVGARIILRKKNKLLHEAAAPSGELAPDAASSVSEDDGKTGGAISA